MTPDRLIGCPDGLPWNVPKEYQDFLDKTRGQTVIMGRKSYEIFGEDLNSQHNLVVSRSENQFDRATTVGSIEEALTRAKETRCRVYVCGGASIYEQAMPHTEITQMDLSIVDVQAEGDRYFPEIDESVWELTAREERRDYDFVRYVRILPACDA